MKKFKILLLSFLLIPCFFMCGCFFDVSEQVYVTGITKGVTIGEETTYIVTYSDGSTSSFFVKNGKDGQDLTLEVIEEYCKEKEITLEEYFSSLNVEINTVQLATNKAVKSAVAIYAESPYSTTSQYKTLSAGAGVIYEMGETDSYIITNYHVVKSTTSQTGVASKITLFQYGTTIRISGVGDSAANGKNKIYTNYKYEGGAITAEYVGGAEEYDIAVVKVATADLLAVNDKACAVTVASGYTLAETAIAIGNPKGEGVAVTSGIISVLSEEIDFDDDDFPSYRVMRIDAAVNGGNSGGGLFNDKGELIGIVNAKIEDLAIDNIAYALPHDNVKKVADNLIYYYKQTNQPSIAKKLYLNVSSETKNSKAIYDENTNTIRIVDQAIIAEVETTGVGYKLGLREGCVIESVTINNVTYTIERAYQFSEILLTVRAGDKIKVNCANASVEPTEITVLESYLLTYSEMNK